MIKRKQLSNIFLAGLLFAKLIAHAQDCSDLTVSVAHQSICDGGNEATFVAVSPTATSWTWSEHGMGTNLYTTGTAAGNYTVVVSDDKGCLDTATGTLTVHPLPVVTLDGGSVCPSASLTLTPVVTTYNQPVTYWWDSGETTQTVSKGVGTYTVIATDAKGCAGAASATVVEDPSSCLVGHTELTLNKKGLSVLPNPSTGVFTISSPQSIESVQIYNRVGEPVKSQTSTQVDITGQPSGLYFIHVRTNASSEILKVVLQ